VQWRAGVPSPRVLAVVISSIAQEAAMSRRPATDLTVEQSARSASSPIARAYPSIVVDRPKRIDDYIDYFGGGGVRSRVVTRDPCGESLLHPDGAR
jgi:hypothetical protein